jgi:SprT protein
VSEQERITSNLSSYLPEGTAITIANWIIQHNVRFKVTKPRRTKLGDYRHPWEGKGHRITINGDLNSYSFLITTVHEFAHLNTWENHKRKVKPHGKEWKAEFKILMQPFLELSIFPEDVKTVVVNYMNNPAASSCSDLQLTKALRHYDSKQVLYLEDIPEDTIFSLNRKRTFIKGQKLRKRFKCKDLGNNRYYLISPIAEVEVVKG